MLIKQWFQILIFGILSTVLTTIPALAAQRISIFYGLFEVSVSIASLETYAKSGDISDELGTYAQYLDRNQMATLRQLLNQPLHLDSVTLSQFFYSSMGEMALEYLGTLIQTEANQSGFYALRSALILAATEPEGLTLLNVLKQFPSNTIRVNLNATQQTIAAFTQLFEQTEQLNAWIAQQSRAAGPPESMTFADLQAPGPWRWRVETLALHHLERDRQLIVDLYQPQFNQPAPVLIISPGLAASRSNFVYLAQHLVSHGFAVAVLDHPGSDRQRLHNLQDGAVSEVILPNEWIERPLDISYLLDELERHNQAHGSDAPFNLQQVGLLGHSFGGYTALALAGATIDLAQLRRICQEESIDPSLANPSLLLQCAAVNLPTETLPPLQDDRIQAIFAFNPIGSSLFGAEGLRQIQRPVMIVGGSQDAIAPVVLEQICPFTWLTAPDRYLALIQGGTHVYSTQSEEGVLPLALTGPAPPLARRYLKQLSLAFAQTHVADRPNYQSYLTATYAQAISQAPIHLRLVQSLTLAELPETIDLACPGTVAEKQ